MFISGSNTVTHPKSRTYEEGLLLPVLSADELLFSSRHKGIIRQCKDLLAVSAEAWEGLYNPLIKRFLEFVQVLPEQNNGILGSLINTHLARTLLVLQKVMGQQQFPVTPLLKFAVFSAALLKGIGRVVTQQHITLVNEEGNYLQDWNPYDGTMVGQALYYKIYQISQRYLRIEKESTLLFARQLISREAFQWLSCDINIFSDWLAALLDEEGSDAKEISWALSLIKIEDILQLLASLEGSHVELQQSDETAFGEAFLRWLKEELAKGSLQVNTADAGIHVVNEGVLIENKIFKQFADLSNVPVNFQVVFTQFGNLMGIPKKCGQDFLNAQYFSPADVPAAKSTAFSSALGQRAQNMRVGMVVSDPGMIFMNAQIPENSGLKSTQKLSAAYQQQPSVNENPALNAQFNPKAG